MESWISDPDAAWWAKLRRANTHLETLAQLVDEFAATEPYTLTAEPGEGVVAYRLHTREAPAEISTVVGDILHNLRSALDSVAYALALHSRGELTEREEQVTAFPWSPSSSRYDRFFGLGVSVENPDDARLVRGRIYDQPARDAMRVVQPFFIWEMAKLSGANLSETERRRLSNDVFKWSAIHRLHQLSNLDKHRRLSAVGVGVPLLWWGSDEGDDTQFRPGHMPPTDNEILCYLVGPNAAKIELQTEFAMVLTDDPTHQPATDQLYRPQDCQELLGGFARDIAAIVQQVLSQYAQSQTNSA
jgi:hypothetical protein